MHTPFVESVKELGRVGRHPRRRLVLPALLLLCVASGCASSGARSGRNAGWQGNGPGDGPMLKALEAQSALMSWSDELIFSVADACDRVEQRTGRPEARVACASKRLGTAIGAISAATSRNVPVGFADLLTLVTLQRMSLDEPWAARTFDGEDRRVLRGAFADAERELWGRAGQILTPQQQRELRAMIVAWRRDHPEQVSLALVRLQDFAAIRQVSLRGRSASGPGSIFGLLWLDPTANVAPATRQLEETRLLAERVKFWGQRLPLVLGWQAEMTSARVLNSGPAREALRSASRLTDTAGAFSRTADRMATSYERMLDDLPGERREAVEQVDRVVADRVRAAISQSAAAVSSERKATIEQLNDVISKNMRVTVDRLGREFDAQSERSFDRTAKLLAAEREQVFARLSAHTAEIDVASRRLVDRIAMRLLLVVILGAFAIACIVFTYRRVEARYAGNGPPTSRRGDGSAPRSATPGGAG